MKTDPPSAQIRHDIHGDIHGAIRCDIFCAVVDNFGDAGVCWRLARQLAHEHGWRVRLWIDDPAPLAKLAPESATTTSMTGHATGHATGRAAMGATTGAANDVANGAADRPLIEVRPWSVANVAEAMPADVVIEAFACELPEPYVARMVAAVPPPVWLNLEYLSAEAWVEGCHGLVSRHSRLSLGKHFFFPGFTAATGGLLREADYAARRAAFDETAFRAEFGLPPRLPGELTVSLFSYPNPALPALLDAWAARPTPLRVLVPGDTGAPWQRGQLHWQPFPFVSQRRYDELLWACDVNFVRGEDSFVRAQWAQKPFVWHIYPQADDAHRHKLDAFLARYAKVGAGDTALRHCWQAWNGIAADVSNEATDATQRATESTAGSPADAPNWGEIWAEFAAALPVLTQNAAQWAGQLAARPDLATNLVQFCHQQLK